MVDVKKFSLKFIDDEGDWVTLASDGDLQEALRLAYNEAVPVKLVMIPDTDVTTDEQISTAATPTPNCSPKVASNNTSASVEIEHISKLTPKDDEQRTKIEGDELFARKIAEADDRLFAQQIAADESRVDAAKLPPGVEVRYDNKQREYYVDHVTKTTSWSVPQRTNYAVKDLPHESAALQRSVTVLPSSGERAVASADDVPSQNSATLEANSTVFSKKIERTKPAHGRKVPAETRPCEIHKQGQMPGMSEEIVFSIERCIRSILPETIAAGVNKAIAMTVPFRVMLPGGISPVEIDVNLTEVIAKYQQTGVFILDLSSDKSDTLESEALSIQTKSEATASTNTNRSLEWDQTADVAVTQSAQAASSIDTACDFNKDETAWSDPTIPGADTNVEVSVEKSDKSTWLDPTIPGADTNVEVSVEKCDSVVTDPIPEDLLQSNATVTSDNYAQIETNSTGSGFVMVADDDVTPDDLAQQSAVGPMHESWLRVDGDTENMTVTRESILSDSAFPFPPSHGSDQGSQVESLYSRDAILNKLVSMGFADRQKNAELYDNLALGKESSQNPVHFDEILSQLMSPNGYWSPMRS